MDTETAEAIERVNDRVDALAVTLRGEMHELRDELRGEMRGLRGEMGGLREELRGEMRGLRGEMGGLRGEMGGLREELRGEMAALEDRLRDEFREGLAESRRHATIQFDSLKDDIRLLAEGFGDLSGRIDRLR